MGPNRHTVDAFSLPAVVVISALVMMLIVFAFSLKTLDFHNHGLYSDLKQARLDLHSATALYMCDSAGACMSLYISVIPRKILSQRDT